MMMWNLDSMMQAAEDRALINPDKPPSDAKELLKRCEEREARFAEDAIAAERDGDTEGTWLAMAARAENNRFMERLRADIAASDRSGTENQSAPLGKSKT